MRILHSKIRISIQINNQKRYIHQYIKDVKRKEYQRMNTEWIPDAAAHPHTPPKAMECLRSPAW